MSLGNREELIQFYQHFSETCRRHQSVLGGPDRQDGQPS